MSFVLNTHCEIAMNDEFFVAGTYELAHQLVHVGLVNLESFVVLSEQGFRQL